MALHCNPHRLLQSLSGLIISAWSSATTPASGASVWHEATVAARSAYSNPIVTDGQ
jgi:hypothetical protein